MSIILIDEKLKEAILEAQKKKQEEEEKKSMEDLDRSYPRSPNRIKALQREKLSTYFQDFGTTFNLYQNLSKQNGLILHFKPLINLAFRREDEPQYKSRC